MARSQSYGESRNWSTSAIALIAIGLGCYLGWQIIDISPTLFPAPRAGVSATILATSYASTGLLIGLLAVFALLSRRMLLLRHIWIILVCALGLSLGTGVLYLCGWVLEEPVMGGVVVGRLLFFTSAGFIVLWGELICHVRPAQIMRCVAAAYVVAFGACLIAAGMGSPAVLIFRTVLPLASGALLVVVRRDVMVATQVAGQVDRLAAGQVDSQTTKQAGDKVAVPERIHIDMPRHALRLFLGIGIFGAIFTVTNHLSETKTVASTELYTLIAGITVSLVLFFICLATRSGYRAIKRVFRLITPLCIACLLMVLVLQPGYQRYEALAIGLSWVYFRIFTWTLWGYMGSRDPDTGAWVFAVGQIVLTLFDTASELFSISVDLTTVSLTLAAAIIILAAILTSVFVMDEGDLAARFLSARGDAGEWDESDESEGEPGRAISSEGHLADKPVVAPFDYSKVTFDDVARVARPLGLSEREQEIAFLVVKRQDNEAICQNIYIAESTLRTHLRNIYKKLDVHSRYELAQRIEDELSKM